MWKGQAELKEQQFLPGYSSSSYLEWSHASCGFVVGCRLRVHARIRGIL